MKIHPIDSVRNTPMPWVRFVPVTKIYLIRSSFGKQTIYNSIYLDA